nr:MAG TPA: holin [Caudoviricetes sp.]
MTVDKLIEIVTLIVFVAPIVLELVKYLGAATHNKSVTTLADRAMIIVSSLDAMLMPNADKKREALNKLLSFAKETKVSLTADQAEDYIEHAVRVLRELQEKPEVVEDASEEK